jgi:hypothetical protein
MEEPGEQYTVVFALIVTGLASKCVCVGTSPPPTLTQAVTATINAKTTVQCFPGSSMGGPKSSSKVEAHANASCLGELSILHWFCE